MTHLAILPFLIPFLAAALLLVAHRTPLAVRQGLSLGATLLAAIASVLLLIHADDGRIAVYALGDWPAPYGIVLVADRLAALMVVTLFAVALPALVMATAGLDQRGPHFHPLFQLQLAGLAAAFLTGDLFNLFVAFEILLLASYALLAHGGGFHRTAAGLRYVVLNLVGSSMFLIALALLYGTLGTLNLADIARLLPDVPPADVPLVRVALMLLALVFLLKSALFPIQGWLPGTYSAAAPAVGCLFAILTKVGVVALLRLDITALADTPVGRQLLFPWLPVLALATVFWGTIGALAARRFTLLVANLLLVSSGTLLFAIGHATPALTAALLFYLPQSTLVAAALFLLAGAITIRRGESQDLLVRGPVLEHRTALGLGFAMLAVAIAGLPPLSGFLGKIMLMQALDGPWRAIWWATLLMSGLVVALVLARAGSILFWEPDGYAATFHTRERIGPARTTALVLLIAASPLFTVFARPIAGYTAATAAQMHARTPYIDAVIATDAAIARQARPRQTAPEPVE